MVGTPSATIEIDFPSFSDGLSLRSALRSRRRRLVRHFPFLSEGHSIRQINILRMTAGPFVLHLEV